jgi:hypothetical protein
MATENRFVPKMDDNSDYNRLMLILDPPVDPTESQEYDYISFIEHIVDDLLFSRRRK